MIPAGRLVGLFALVGGSVGCAGFGESLAGVCLAIALQSAAEVCCEAAVGAVCDEELDIGDDNHVTAIEELPPAQAAEASSDAAVVEAPAPPPCRQRELPGGVWRLDCVDGTAAEALVGATPAGPADADVGVIGGGGGGGGDVDRTIVTAAVVDVAGLDDVARLVSVRGLAGSLHIGGPALLSVSLPSLRTVGRDLVVERTVQLGSLRLDGLRRVDGSLRVTHNRALAMDPFPVLGSAGAVDVAFNDALPAAVVDRLLAIGPPPPPP